MYSLWTSDVLFRYNKCFLSRTSIGARAGPEASLTVQTCENTAHDFRSAAGRQRNASTLMHVRFHKGCCTVPINPFRFLFPHRLRIPFAKDTSQSATQKGVYIRRPSTTDKIWENVRQDDYQRRERLPCCYGFPLG